MSEAKVTQFPLDDLPAWCARHGVKLHPLIKAVNVDGHGNGWIALESNGPFSSQDEVLLLSIPREVIFSTAYVKEYANANESFRQLFEALPEFSPRLLIILFMLVQLALLQSSSQPDRDVVEPWREYTLLQSADVLVSTMWSPAELSPLKDTSLESTVAAKLALLQREFSLITLRTRSLRFWHETLFHNNGEPVSLQHWIWLDALFRSRSFDLPRSGESMVPCLDLANHSNENTAYFRQETQTESVTLMIRREIISALCPGDEITISYGRDKPAAEMLFNYGFIPQDPNGSTTSVEQSESLMISLDDTPSWTHWARDDPFLAAKLELFNDAPMLRLSVDREGVASWSCSFVYILCVGEEDGFEFKKAQGEDGRSGWTLLWHGKEISRMAGMLGLWLNAQGELSGVVQGRLVSVLSGVVADQLKKMRPLEVDAGVVKDGNHGIRPSVLRSVIQLRKVETRILERCLQALEEERNRLRA
ncbi:uncharacterized protein B0T15DRAFT_433510 [Chaetomium strumarium]|uniref:SET domain-containing protein n=1 Tax=Chaetomium strumarium TaxID=1170767 RepID=A0AAJ0M0Z4_9PEZI|nr:hypothetical protein B0T15DRAFT_433510 [Chaetomium strumarium]